MPTGTITALVAQQQPRRRVNLFIDGEFALGISHTTLIRERLAVGVIIDAARWDRLAAAESADRALNYAMTLLERSPRTAHQLLQKLQRHEFDTPIIEQTLTRLTELGLIDDADYAQRWIAARARLRPRGRLALQAELRARGIAADVVQQAITERDPADESAQLHALAEQMLPRYLHSPDWATFQRRFGGFLARRGFDAGAIRRLLPQLWHRARRDDPDTADDAPA